MKKLIMVGFFLIFSFASYAQALVNKKENIFVDLAITAGQQQGSLAGSYVHNWKFGFGKKKNWEAGLGARFTSALGNNLEFLTAGPAKFTRGNDIPFLTVVSAQRPENWDTLTVQSPWTNSLNLTANFAYNLSPKWSLGFNIDLIGVSFGRNSNAEFLQNGINTTESSTKPTVFNILLTGDNDRGSLNSEYFLKYQIHKRWAIKGVYQFLFTEYTTENIRQILPDGTSVNRFRNKASNLGIGVSYKL